jgi:hypothetical protein
MLCRTVARSGRRLSRCWGARRRGARYRSARCFLDPFAAASAASTPAALSVPVALGGRTLYGPFGDNDRVGLRLASAFCAQRLILCLFLFGERRNPDRRTRRGLTRRILGKFAELTGLLGRCAPGVFAEVSRRL